MPNFELVFSKSFSCETSGVSETGEMSYVITVPDILLANFVAEAMRGHEVYANEWLDDIIRVEATDEQAYVTDWDDGTLLWKKVLFTLCISEGSVEPIRGLCGEIVGFQRRGCA